MQRVTFTYKGVEYVTEQTELIRSRWPITWVIAGATGDETFYAEAGLTVRRSSVRGQELRITDGRQVPLGDPYPTCGHVRWGPREARSIDEAVELGFLVPATGLVISEE